MKSKLSCKKSILTLCAAGLVAGILAGCASTQVSDRQELVTGQIPKPGNILVYDFAATAADVPAESALADEADVDTTPQTAEQMAEGKKLGAQIASELAAEIRGMGLTAQEASPQMQPRLNDLVIRGFLLSVKQGSAVKRIAIGFGSGASELRTMVEGFQMTAQGLRKLGVN